MPSLKPRPDGVPSTPAQAYKKEGWLGFGDWLGTGTIAPRLRRKALYPKFESARSFARSLGFKKRAEWDRFCKGDFPANMSKSPQSTYKNSGWISWPDWLNDEKA